MITRHDDDLFAESTMTFGEHLEELRGALFRALIGLAIGFLLGCLVAGSVVELIQSPLTKALKAYEEDRARDRLKVEFGDPLPPEIDRMVDAGYVPQDKMWIEPFGFLERLKSDYPDQFPFDFTQHKFISSDIRTDGGWVGSKDATPALAAKLVADGGDAKSSAGKELWNNLSPAQQEFLEKLAAQEESTEADRARLVQILNGLLEMQELHRSEPMEAITSFSNSDTKGAVQELRDRHTKKPGSLTDDDSRRLNRLLISAYLHDYLRPPRVNVVELPTWRKVDKRLQSLSAEEAFMIWVKAALVTGAIISSPWIFYQIWLFVAAGLYPHEKKYIYVYLPISLGLFLAGALLAFNFVFEPVLNFLFWFNKSMNIDPDPRIGEWLGFVLFLPVGFGISFQLPLVMLFLNRIGIFSTKVYLEKWRISVLVIFVLSMVLTPADPISMLLMAVPLTVLYFGGILMCKYMPKGRSPFDEAYEPS